MAEDGSDRYSIFGDEGQHYAAPLSSASGGSVAPVLADTSMSSNAFVNNSFLANDHSMMDASVSSDNSNDSSSCTARKQGVIRPHSAIGTFQSTVRSRSQHDSGKNLVSGSDCNVMGDCTTEFIEDDEDPHERVRNATTASAFITFLKALFGVSLLFQPRILGETGLILGTLVHMIIIACCAFACYLLLSARTVAMETRERQVLEDEHQQRLDELAKVSGRDEGTPVNSKGHRRSRSQSDSDPYLVRETKQSMVAMALAPASAASPSASTSLTPIRLPQTNQSRSISPFQSRSVSPISMPSTILKQSSEHKGGPFCGWKDRFITYSDLVRQLLGKKTATIMTSMVFILHILFAAGMVNSAIRNLQVLAGWHINDNEEEYEYEPDPGRRILQNGSEGQGEQGEDEDEFTESASGHLAITALVFPVVLKLLLIRNLSGMFFVSALGLIAYVVGCVGSMVYSAMTFSEWEGGIDAPEDMWDWKWTGIPAYVASTVYAIEGIQLALPTANNIADPKKTAPLVGGAIFLYGLLTIAVAWVGYIGGLGGGPGTRHGENGCDYISYCLSSDFLTMVHEFSLSLALLFTLPVILYPSTELLEMWVNERQAAKAAELLSPKKHIKGTSWWSSFAFRITPYAQRMKLFPHSPKTDSNKEDGYTTQYVDMDAPGYMYPASDKELGVEMSPAAQKEALQSAADTRGKSTSDEVHGSPSSKYTENSLETKRTPNNSRPSTPTTIRKHPADEISAHFYPRLGLAISVCVIGSLEFRFYSMINFTRGVLLSIAGFIVPPILYFAAVKAEKRLNPLMMLALAGLMMFGIFTMVLAFIPSFTNLMTVDVDEALENNRGDRSHGSQD